MSRTETAPVLVTGATGFLGSWILARLLGKGKAVVALDLTPDPHRLDNLLPEHERSAIRWMACDVTDGAQLLGIVGDVRPSAIIHLAALQIPACRENPALGAEVNIVGQINVLEAARMHGVERLIYTSSIAAKPRGPANAPDNLYGVFKKAGEEIARLYWRDHGVPSLGLRPFIVYGVGRDEGETSAVTEAIRAAALGRPFTMPFSTRSCFQYAGEVADIFGRCIDARWQGALVSDLTTDIQSTDAILDAIHQVVPDADITASTIERAAPTDGFDNQPLKDIIGPWPNVPLEAGVSQTVMSYRQLARRSNPV